MQILTRLNAKAGISEGYGGIPELTTSDIAAALNGTNPQGLSVLLAAVCGVGDAEAIYKDFIPDLARLAFREKWRLRTSDAARMHILLKIAVYEVVNTNTCPSCKGTKYSLMNPSESCVLCNGSGKWLIIDQQKASFIGVHKSNYCRTWKDRYESIKYLLERRAYQARQRIYNNLRGKALT